MKTQNSKVRTQNYNSKLINFELLRGVAEKRALATIVKVLAFDFCLLSYLRTGGSK